MRDPDILAQQRREHPDPHESPNPVPWPVLALVTLLLAFGVVYIAQSKVETPGAWGDGRTREELAGTARGQGGRADGAALFAARCAACHQASGTGLPGVFPPLAGSEWVNGKDSTLAALVLRGIDGPLTVKGTTYRGTMPSFMGQLSDDELAAVLTHLRAHWGNASPPVTAATVAAAREQHKNAAGPFGGDVDLAPLR